MVRIKNAELRPLIQTIEAVVCGRGGEIAEGHDGAEG
jgi:hypothetical protein